MPAAQKVTTSAGFGKEKEENSWKEEEKRGQGEESMGASEGSF